MMPKTPEVITSTHLLLKKVGARSRSLNSPEPKLTRSLRRYVREFETGVANPHGIRVRIRFKDGREIDEPVQLTDTGRVSSQYRLPPGPGRHEREYVDNKADGQGK